MLVYCLCFLAQSIRKTTILGLIGQLKGGEEANCGLHPLIHTLLKFNLAQYVRVSQRFSGLGNEPLQTGHILSSGPTIMVSLHLEHLTRQSLTRSISAGSRLVIRLLRIRRVTLWWSETGSQWVSLIAVPAEDMVIVHQYSSNGSQYSSSHVFFYLDLFFGQRHFFDLKSILWSPPSLCVLYSSVYLAHFYGKKGFLELGFPKLA